ncbi:MAG: ATP-binding protein [Thermomicrobiales bacterium]
MTPVIPLIPVTDPGPHAITPTDVSQFIRLGQCQRYLRLQLDERSGHSRFMRDAGVATQTIPPLLTQSGRAFELATVRDIGAILSMVQCSPEDRQAAGLPNDNELVIECVEGLEPGQAVVIYQPRVEAMVGSWSLRGDLDLLRLERDAEGRLHILIADMKSSTAAKVEHRLQVAFYERMIAALLADVPHEPIQLAILYRGPAPGGNDAPETAPTDEQQAQREDAARTFGATTGLLERIEDTNAYLGAADDLVLKSESVARKILATPFPDLPFHLGTICDGCAYNAFCMKQCAEVDDLSLIPHISAGEKGALRAEGVTTVRALARLKEMERKDTIQVDGEPRDHTVLLPRPRTEALTRKLAATWPVGPNLDELIFRARRYRSWVGDDIDSVSDIPNTGYSSLPFVDAEHNPNLVRVYLDAQHDYLNDRVAMLGALVVGAERGETPPERRRSIVRLANRQPHDADVERDLLLDWVGAVLRAVEEVAAPELTPLGEPSAPIHLIFFNTFAQTVLLEALGRHATDVLGATALYDFVTQTAAFDSPLVSYLDREIRAQTNYPMVCQSLQSVAALLKFDWDTPESYRRIFRERLFDYRAQLDEDALAFDDTRGHTWYTSKARFDSQVPLEYLHAAWGELPDPKPAERDALAPYRLTTREVLTGFEARRLEAMEWIAGDIRGNKQTSQTAFVLPDLAAFTAKASTLAEALDEFLTIERHVELAAWKGARNKPPEERVLDGEALVVSFHNADQDPEMLAAYQEFARRERLAKQYEDAYKAAHPGERGMLTPEQKAETKRNPEGIVLRMRVDVRDVACDLDEALALSSMKPGERLVLAPRLTVDERLPEAERTLFTPTPKSLLYRMRVDLRRLDVQRDDGGKATSAIAEIGLLGQFGGRSERGYSFGGHVVVANDGETFSLDPDPNNYYGGWLAKVTEGLRAGGENAVYAHLAGQMLPPVIWPDAAARGQARFLAGLQALDAAGALHDFEASKRDYIGGHGGDPLLMVQGPPGTGKSYSTAFAIFARIQGAMAAGIDCRVAVSCKTHAATNVLLKNVLDVQEKLRDRAERHPEIWGAYFDDRLLEVPLFRHGPRVDEELPELIVPLPKKGVGAWNRIASPASRWSVTGATPGGMYRIVTEKFARAKGLFGHGLVDLVVLDEASQMNIPEAVMATLPLHLHGRLVVVGDHRQMPPIVKNDWGREVRRSFQQFRAFESLFVALRERKPRPPIVRFAESFRLHAVMAEFLREEIYRHDDIPYFSRRHKQLSSPKRPVADEFVWAALDPEQPLTVIVHDEDRSQRRNPFEQALIAPILEALAAGDSYALDAVHGMGVVVPHRAQRAALQEAIPALTVRDEETGAIRLSAVDTVERFQGDERNVIVIGATESDPGYLLENGDFLLDPRRLTVALSRAKEKLILVAARSVFEIFSADEETFANAQLWKNLLGQTCIVPIWRGERDGTRVEVWGNLPPDL